MVLNEIYLQGLSVIPEQRDTLFTLASTRIKLNFWKFTHQENRSKLHSSRRYQTHIYKQDSIANYDFLFKKDRKVPSQTSGQTVTEINYAEKINKLLNFKPPALRWTISSMLPRQGFSLGFCVMFTYLLLSWPPIHKTCTRASYDIQCQLL